MDPQRTLTGDLRFGEPDAEPLGSLLLPNRLSQWSWVLGYTALLSTVTVMRYHLWLATGWDLGFNEQALWLLSHRGILAVSSYTGHPILADAASYILVLLAPLYRVGGVGLLLLLQAFALGLGYLFIRRIAERLGVSDRWGQIIGIIYLLYPTVLGANLFDFHPDVLAVPLLLALVWAAISERWVAYVILLLLSLAVKDTVPIVVVGMGITLLVRKRFAWGGVTVATGALAFVLDVLVVIPHLLHGTMTQWASYYGTLGPTPSAFAVGVLSHPGLLFGWVRSLRSWEYLFWLFAPLVVVAAFGRRRALSAFLIPALMLIEVNLLANSGITTDPFNQYSLFAVPFLFTAALEAVKGADAPALNLSKTALVLPLALLAVFAWHERGPDWSGRPGNAAALIAASATVPKNAPVVTQNVLAAYFADRAWEKLPAYVVGTTLQRGTYVVVNGTDPLASLDPDPPGSDQAVLHALSSKGAAKAVFSQDQVTVYKLLRSVRVGSAR